MGAPSPRWGWHQLDACWAERLVTSASLSRGDLVLDVGAGLGALTEPLLAQGARVIAVELHPGRAQHLRERFGDRAVIVQADAGSLRLPRRPFHVVANPPFAVTTPLLRRLLQPNTRLRSAHVVLQDQAARRWVSRAAPGATRWTRTHTARLGPRIPRRAFTPRAPVDGRVLIIERHGG